MVMISGHKTLNFTTIPERFREIVKKYVRYRSVRFGFIALVVDIRSLRVFTRFILEKYPKWTTFEDLSRVDMEEYLVYLNNVLRKEQSIAHRINYWGVVKDFITYLQHRAGYFKMALTFLQLLQCILK
jgi:hypothetical protein